MAKAQLLLVEDDDNLGEILQEYLEAKGYPTVLEKDGRAGWEAYQKKHYDLCLLDVMLPKMDGFTIAEKIRQTDKETPIIFLTAKSLPEDTLKGFKAGADDYLTKPFSMEELLVRMKAILRRTMHLETPISSYELGKLLFDVNKQELQWEGQSQKLTSKESALLALLSEHKNRTLNRSYALKKIWNDDSYFNARSMDVYITKLRKYLKVDESLQILNIHGEGFRLVTE